MRSQAAEPRRDEAAQPGRLPRLLRPAPRQMHSLGGLKLCMGAIQYSSSQNPAICERYQQKSAKCGFLVAQPGLGRAARTGAAVNKCRPRRPSMGGSGGRRPAKIPPRWRGMENRATRRSTHPPEREPALERLRAPGPVGVQLLAMPCHAVAAGWRRALPGGVEGKPKLRVLLSRLPMSASWHLSGGSPWTVKSREVVYELGAHLVGGVVGCSGRSELFHLFAVGAMEPLLEERFHRAGSLPDAQTMTCTGLRAHEGGEVFEVDFLIKPATH